MVQTATAISQVARQEEENSLSNTSFNFLAKIKETPLHQETPRFTKEVIGNNQAQIERKVLERAKKSNGTASLSVGEIASEVKPEAINTIVQLSETLDISPTWKLHAQVMDSIDSQLNGAVATVVAQQKNLPDESEPQAQKDAPIKTPEVQPSLITTANPQSQTIAEQISNDALQTTEMPSPLGKTKIQIPVLTPMADKLLSDIEATTKTNEPWLNIQTASTNKPISQITEPLVAARTPINKKSIRELDLGIKS